MADVTNLSPADLALEELRALETARPDVVALAMAASLARKIEPELLRAVRLGLADRLPTDSCPHAGTEAALWFSGLVESRGPDSITLLPEVSRELQGRLKSDSALFEAARAVIEDCHRAIAPVLRWEEELVYVALTPTLTDLSRQQRIRDAARQALEAISASPRPGLEDRVREMWTRLPTPATINSYLANLHHLCDVRALRRRGGGSETDSDFETTLLHARRIGHKLHLGFLRQPGQVTFQVPAIDPVTLDVLKTERSRRALRTMVIQADQWIEVPFEDRPLILRTIDGRVYSLTPERFESPSTAVVDASDLSEARLILLGAAGVGKTSLAIRLTQQTDYALPTTQDLTTTHGIQISDWRIKPDGLRETLIHIWDFGGQQVYYGVDELFFGGNAVYLVVLEARRGNMDADAEFWLSRATAYSADSPIVVVLNKIRQGGFSLNRDAFSQKYPNIKAFVETDLLDNFGIDELRVAISSSIATLPRMTAPRSWIVVRERLSARKENYLDFGEYRALCTAGGIANAEEQDAFARMLHSLGSILHFGDDPKLRQTMVLRPDWIANGIASIISSDTARAKQGEIHSSDLFGELDPQQYPSSQYDFILGVMQRFELCLQYPPPDDHIYLIPELLDPQQPALPSGFEVTNCLNWRYKYSIWLQTLITRFIVRTHTMSLNLPRWRYGVVLGLASNVALVRADPQQRLVNISVQGPAKSRRSLLASIRSSFADIHKTIPSLTVEEGVPLPENPSVAISYDILEKRLASGRSTVISPTTGEEFDILTLLGEPAAALPTSSGPVKVFLSYAHKEKALLDQFRPFLAPFERDGLLDIWEDSEIRAGEEWLPAANQGLESADLIILLVSPDFLASELTGRIEMKRALEQRESGHSVVVPVIVRPCDWKESELGSIQVLPRTAGSITEHKHPDAAWREVSEEIRRLAQDLRSSRLRIRREMS
jgi:internalin A